MTSKLSIEQVLAACETSLKKGRVCQISLTPTVVHSDIFKQWLIRLYQQYPANQLAERLIFVDHGQDDIHESLLSCLQIAAFQTLKHNNYASIR